MFQDHFSSFFFFSVTNDSLLCVALRNRWNCWLITAKIIGKYINHVQSKDDWFHHSFFKCVIVDRAGIQPEGDRIGHVGWQRSIQKIKKKNKKHSFKNSYKHTQILIFLPGLCNKKVSEILHYIFTKGKVSKQWNSED